MSIKANDLKILEELNILYVEDEKSIREELEFFLSNKVKNLYLASNGEEALAIYKENKIDLVITDIQMPKMTGIELAQEIKKINSNTKIIFVTAFHDTNFLHQAIKLNVSSYLTKPLELTLLVEAMIELSSRIVLEKENEKLTNMFEQYKSIVDERTIVSKTNKKGIITYVNKPFEEISGFFKNELIGKSHNIVRHEETKDEVFHDMWKTILSKKVWSGKIKNKKKSGEYYIVDTLIKPIVNVDGQIEEFIALRNDITEIEDSKDFFKSKNDKATSNLQETIRLAKTYRDVIDKSNIIIRVTLDRKINFVNEGFCNISGYTKEDVIGKDYVFLKDPSEPQNYYDEKTEEMFSALDKGEIWEGKISNIRKNGKTFYCKATVFPLFDKDGNVYEYMGVRHDITDIEKLHVELEDTQRELIYRLGEVGETRSKETGNHVKRVATYSKILAKLYGLSDEESNILFAASPMHDIGKVGIPDSILNKPGKFDEQEWQIMKTHSTIGYELLNKSKRPILQAAAIVSYTHHEKWDGSGYPRALKGEEIHIYGRITAVADVFDALGSNRVYKKAWLLEKILELFKEQRAKHFDPKLVDLFFDNLDKFLSVRDKYID